MLAETCSAGYTARELGWAVPDKVKEKAPAQQVAVC